MPFYFGGFDERRRWIGQGRMRYALDIFLAKWTMLGLGEASSGRGRRSAFRLEAGRIAGGGAKAVFGAGFKGKNPLDRPRLFAYDPIHSLM